MSDEKLQVLVSSVFHVEIFIPAPCFFRKQMTFFSIFIQRTYYLEPVWTKS